MNRLINYICVFVAGLIFGTIVVAQDLTIKGDTKTVKVDRVIVVKEDALLVNSLPFTVNAPVGAGDYRWTYPVGFIVIEKDESLEVTTAPKGTHVVSCRVLNADIVDGKIKWNRKTLSISFAVGEVGPGPKPPDPPTPAPQGFRVLLIHEAQEKSPAFFDARSVKTYLDAKTVKDGTHPSWRRLDKDQSGANLPTDLRLLWEAAKPRVTAVPCVVIAVNSQVTIHPLPKDEAGLIDLLKSKGGE